MPSKRAEYVAVNLIPVVLSLAAVVWWITAILSGSIIPYAAAIVTTIVALAKTVQLRRRYPRNQ